MSVEKRQKEQEKTSMVVEGFLFANEAEAAQARKEAEGVKYVKEKAQMDDPEMVLRIYNKMIQQRLFDTAVGYSYLKDLQEYLQSIPFIRKIFSRFRCSIRRWRRVSARRSARRHQSRRRRPW